MGSSMFIMVMIAQRAATREDESSVPLSDEPPRQFFRPANQHIGRVGQKSFGLEAPGDTAATDTRIAGGLDIDSAIADHPGPGWLRASILDQCPDANGIRFFLRETVASIDPTEVPVERERRNHIAADAHRLVGQDGELVSLGR